MIDDNAHAYTSARGNFAVINLTLFGCLIVSVTKILIFIDTHSIKSSNNGFTPIR